MNLPAQGGPAQIQFGMPAVALGQAPPAAVHSGCQKKQKIVIIHKHNVPI